MEIEKCETGIKVLDNDQICGEITIGTKVLQFNLDAFFTQDEIKSLLPYLQAFAETGTFEPQSPLQGKEEREFAKNTAKRILEYIEEQEKRIEALEQLLEKTSKEKAYYVRACDKQVDQIAELEELLEKWRLFGKGVWECEHPDTLEEKSAKLLGENDGSV